MSIEPIGVVTVLAGLLVLYLGPNFGIYALTISSLLGAAAVIKLPALGDANIQPVHLILCFYVIAVATTRDGIKDGLKSLAFPSPGFWCALFVVFCLLTAVLMPRLFEGATDVLSITRNDAGQRGFILTPLMPRPSNITQSIYIAADLVLFAAVAAHAMGGALPTIVRAVLVAAIFNLGFGALDLATYATGTSEIMSVIRNANYGMQVGVAIGGIKRVAGSFTEASVFGGTTLLFFAFSVELWLQNRFRGLAGPIALLSLLALVLATSSSTYVGLGIYALLLWARCAVSVLGAQANGRKLAIALVGPPAALVLVIAVMLLPAAWDTVLEIANATLVNKLNTQSGIERWYWNENGLRVFHETAMLGAGVGSVRTSSLIVGLFANVGIVGFGLFLGFIASLCRAAMLSSGNAGTDAYVTAGSWAGFTLLVSAILAATGVDLGLLFHLCAAIVSQAVLAPQRRGYRPVLRPIHAWRGEGFYGA